MTGRQFQARPGRSLEAPAQSPMTGHHAAPASVPTKRAASEVAVARGHVLAPRTTPSTGSRDPPPGQLAHQTQNPHMRPPTILHLPPAVVAVILFALVTILGLIVLLAWHLHRKQNLPRKCRCKGPKPRRLRK